MISSTSTVRFAAQTDATTSLLAIVNLVRKGEATTKPDIGRVTGLGRGVVTQRVEQAITLGYLEEADFGPSSGGRAPRTLRFRAERGRILVCAMGALHLRVGVTDLDGRILARSHRVWDIASGPDATTAMAMRMFDDILDADARSRIWGVGVGVPGPVEFESGRPVAPPIMPGWNGFDVRRPFIERFGAPVWVDNDVNLLALSERSRRRESGQDDLIYFKVGSGIGVGLLSKGHLHRGANGAAGDIGHVRIHDAGRLCRCGKTGCLEASAGGWALVRDALEAVERGESQALAAVRERTGEITPVDISIAAQNGDAVSIGLVQRSARLVGESLATLVNVFNPAVIVVGGAISASGEIFLAEVRQRVYELSLPLATRDLVLVRSINDEDDPIRGGAELVREQLFEIHFGRWFAEGQPSLSALETVN
ncbi:putative NBD/HSP70 family sugar kinase [Thermocatellispora tengchongensis]|uniref:Putative NBD/HSP70 family sugar kinase n=1 Tax=Thermocatellispora tengchongensis TaxID=1073253 RepID=A0A840PHN1_9ACTN|nr:ROK family protein [Thermocatellispora tengchongensis]MBB5138479.1 putative NBD/HSP70 family sugar kinase [Thermocatellispora tengchongensis]